MIANIQLVKPSIPNHTDISLQVREQVSSIFARVTAIKRVLANPAAMPDMIVQAKGELVVLAREALNLAGEL